MTPNDLGCKVNDLSILFLGSFAEVHAESRSGALPEQAGLVLIEHWAFLDFDEPSLQEILHLERSQQN